MFVIQVDKTIFQIIKIFHRIGMWQSDDEPTYRKIGNQLFYTFFGTLFPIFFINNAILFDDWNESIFSIEAAIIASVVYLKLLYLLFKKQDILEFLNDRIVTHTHSIENGEDYAETNKKIEKIIKFVYIV